MSAYRYRRMLWSRWLLVLAFAAVSWQLYSIQVLRGGYYAVQARHMNMEEVALEDHTRGRITDRNGIPLTGTYQSNRLVVFPQLMDNRDTGLAALARVLGMEPGALLKEAARGAFILDQPLIGARLQALRDAHPPGVFLLPVEHRYGNQPLAAHITGHLGKIDSTGELDRLKRQSGKYYSLGDWVGKAGLEYFYEAELKGQQPQRRAYLTRDAVGRVLKGPGLAVETDGADPARLNVRTTIDAGIQQTVEQVMDAGNLEGAVVVMKAGTGDILALASRPGYHPSPDRMAEIIAAPSGEVFLDRGTALFQPGSIFKIVLAAAALETGLAGPDTSTVCAGSAARPVKCWHKEGHGEISFADAFIQSCNPYFVELGRSMGAGPIIHYARALGLDNPAIAGYPQAPHREQDLSLIGRDYNLPSSSIGQGPVLITPVQAAAMLNTIASGGIYHQPRLVTVLTDNNDHIIKHIDAPPPRRAISPSTAAQLQFLLRQVTEKGVGQNARPAGWSSAGKTGSAEIAGQTEAVNAWFAGYVPAENPRYVITVLVQNGKSGGETAAPVFRDIAQRLLQADSDAAAAEY